MGKKSLGRYRSDFIMPKKSFLGGAGSIINLFGNYFRYDVSKHDAEADRRAFENDLNMLHQDFMNVVGANKRKLG